MFGEHSRSHLLRYRSLIGSEAQDLARARLTRRLIRTTSAKHRGNEIVVEPHATVLFVRTKGSRDSYSQPYSEFGTF